VLTAFTLIFLIVVVPLCRWRGTPSSTWRLLGIQEPLRTSTRRSDARGIAVCLIPTTIGALLAAIASRMDRALQANIIAKSGKAGRRR